MSSSSMNAGRGDTWQKKDMDEEVYKNRWWKNWWSHNYLMGAVEMDEKGGCQMSNPKIGNYFFF
jgi:hypothetical protein